MARMTTDEEQTPAGGLGSTRSTQLLNQIDKIRANGVGDLVSLPQIVVCGDQSSGKSSVLERVSGIPFPRKDGLCTRFPTEIILRHANIPQQIIASIQPHSRRPPELQDVLKQYHRKLSHMSELPAVIEEAASLMQIRGHGNSEATSSFAADVLRIEITAPTGLHLTIVDLPGLISVPNEVQTEDDVHIVRELVESYVSSSRTIILAVLQAPNDIANQSIVQLARKHDPEGRRTVGVLTKTDLINRGVEPRIATLAKNLDTITLKLGFFLLKNPNPSEIEAGLSSEAQSQGEIRFFSEAAWKEQNLDWSRIGVEKLKPFLQTLLEEHIERELPKVRDEIEGKLKEIEKELGVLGHERRTVGQIRSFLTDVSMRFYQLAHAACSGNYHGPNAGFFSETEYRLRAAVHTANGKFSDYMRDYGGYRKKTDSSNVGLPLFVTEEKMMLWIRSVYEKTRGLELPGNYNHIFLAELFHEQSSRWPAIAEKLVQKVAEMVCKWIGQGISDTVPDDHVRHEVLGLCIIRFRGTERLATEELEKLINDERKQPITYNHYYTDNIQKWRNESTEKILKPALSEAVGLEGTRPIHGNKTERVERVSHELQTKIVVNMVEQACNEAEMALNSYYKVAMKTFVDNVCRQVIERHLLTPLPTIFSPQVVAGLSDEELLRIGSEPRKKQDRRAQLKATAEVLRKSLVDLQGSFAEL
ncbi:putative dynamin GTPase [Hypoxylon crocopeplum]|nr:putative dynamin GTPase [Hypoxylon crocopeplum]